jgi:hypothetical protein
MINKRENMDFSFPRDLEEAIENLEVRGEGELFVDSGGDPVGWTSALFTDKFETFFKYLLIRCHNIEERNVLRICRIALAKAYRDVMDDNA